MGTVRKMFTKSLLQVAATPSIFFFKHFSTPKSGSASLPLKNLSFVIEGKVDKEQIKKDVEKLGGRVSKTVKETTAAVISDEGRTVGAFLSILILFSTVTIT